MVQLLEDAYSKLDWAEKRLGELKGEIGRFREGHPEAVTSHFDAKTGDYFFEADAQAIPQAVHLLTSEVAGHTRSALDYLIYALAWLDAGEPQDGTQFPITDAPERFEREVRRGRLRG